MGGQRWGMPNATAGVADERRAVPFWALI